MVKRIIFYLSLIYLIGFVWIYFNQNMHKWYPEPIIYKVKVPIYKEKIVYKDKKFNALHIQEIEEGNVYDIVFYTPGWRGNVKSKNVLRVERIK